MLDRIFHSSLASCRCCFQLNANSILLDLNHPSPLGLLRHVLYLLPLLVWLGSCRSDRTTSSRRVEVEKLHSQADVLVNLSPDSALRYADSALLVASAMPPDELIILRLSLIRAEALVEKNRFTEAIAVLEPLHYKVTEQGRTEMQYQSAALLGRAFLGTGQIRLAKTFLAEGVQLSEVMLKDGAIAELVTLLGDVAQMEGNLAQASIQYAAAERLLDSIPGLKPVIALPRKKALHLLSSGDTSSALALLAGALDRARQTNDTLEWFHCLRGQALALRHNEPDRSIGLLQQALEISAPFSEEKAVIQTRLDLADLLRLQGRGSEALELLRHEFKLAQADRDPWHLFMSASKISEVWENERKSTEALAWIDSALACVHEGLSTEALHRIVIRKAQLIRQSGKPEVAFTILEKGEILVDSLAFQNKKIASAEMEQVFRNERKGIENELLQAELNREITFQRLLFGTMIVSAIIALILGLLLRQRRELNQHLGNAYNVLMDKYRSGYAADPFLARMRSHNGTTRHPSTDAQEENDLLEKVLQYLREEKPFLDPKFRVETAANRLQITQKQLSQAIRSSESGSFNTLVNRFRVEESIRLMGDPELSNYKVEFIGYKAGFGTKQTFYTAFEQHTGITPGFFRSKLQETGDTEQEN